MPSKRQVARSFIEDFTMFVNAAVLPLGNIKSNRYLHDFNVREFVLTSHFRSFSSSLS